MTSRKESGLFVVEDLGHVHSLSLPAGPERTAVSVVPLPGGNAKTFAIDVLNALDKRSWSTAVSVQRKDPVRSALTWLRTAEISHVYVPNADWMNASQCASARTLSKVCAVWLLFAQKADRDLIGKLDPELRDAGELFESTVMLVPGSSNVVAVAWEGFPTPPTCGTFEFRGACIEILTADQMAVVDDAMRVGGAIVRRAIARGEGQRMISASVRETKGPDWCSLAMVHGARLAALQHGWRLKFDRSIWAIDRESAGEISASDCETLLALYDAYVPAMYVLMRVGRLTASDLRDLLFKNASPDGTWFEQAGLRVEIPTRLASIMRAYLLEHCDGREGDDPLFVSRTGSELRDRGIRQRIDNFCARTALPRPISLVQRQGGANLDFFVDFRQL